MVLGTKDAQTSVLEAAGLTGVCTNEHLTVLKAFGDTSIYLKNENFNFELSELLPAGVVMMVKAVAYKALKSKQKITLSDVNFDVNGIHHLVNIVISPFFTAGNQS
jgi:hypothetical protein